jgi:hypothetical protein
VNFVEHVTEDDLERYAMRTLSAPESDHLEEHGLIGQSGRDRLESTDEFVAAMRAAAARIRRGGTGE